MQYDPLLGRYTRKAFARKIELDFSNIEDESDNENVSNANRSQARKLPDWTKKQEPNSHTSDKKEKEKTERKPPRGVTKTKNGLTRNEIIKKHGIKRPASGYIRFTQEFRQRKNKDSVKMKMTEMTKAAAELWKSMTTEQKAPYNDACEKEKAIFEEKVQEAINNDDGKPYDPETRKRKSSTVKGSLASIIQNNVKIKRGLKGKRVPRSSLRRRNGKYLPLDAEDHDPEFGDLDDFGGFTEHDKEIVHELPNPNGGNNSNLNEDNSDSDEYDDDEIESTYDSEPDKTQTKDDTKRSLNLFDENDSDNEELFGLIGLGRGNEDRNENNQDEQTNNTNNSDNNDNPDKDELETQPIDFDELLAPVSLDLPGVASLEFNIHLPKTTKTKKRSVFDDMLDEDLKDMKK